MTIAGLVDLKKLKAAVLVGLLLGVGLTISFVSSERDEGQTKYRAIAQSVREVAAMLPADFLSGAKPESPEMPVAPEAVPTEDLFEPADFLDASMELLLEAGKDGGPAEVQLESGERLAFSVLPSLQSQVERLFADYNPEEAAFVAIDPRTGEVLALAGWANGELAPHRALQADGPAASIFKVVSGAALLEEHSVKPGKQFCFHGGKSAITKRLLDPDPEKDSACMTFAEAMGKSANVIFARLADKYLSRQEMKRFGERFGFNRVIPFVWPVELSKLEVPEDRLEFARMAAGFHHSKLSPLHGAMLAGAVANGGLMMQPQILQSVASADGVEVYRSQPRPFQRAISAKTARKLARMMVTTTTDGTARKYFARTSKELQDVVVAGKTGSLSQSKDGNRLYHSWLVGFAPAENPQIAFASLVVNGPKWRVKGPYVAKRALEAFFKEVPTKPSRMAQK
jgi:peptidoglycan glycosyltransferase